MQLTKIPLRRFPFFVFVLLDQKNHSTRKRTGILHQQRIKVNPERRFDGVNVQSAHERGDALEAAPRNQSAGMCNHQ